MTVKLPPGRPTTEDVQDFWKFMTGAHDVKVINKRNSVEMKTVGEVLDLIGVLDKDEFLERFTTVIPVGSWRGIYVPFDLGVPKPGWSLWGQMVVCVHETEHIIQAAREGELGYSWNYLISPAKRAHYEAEAYRCNMEINFRYLGDTGSPRWYSEKLVHYGCAPMDIKVTTKELALGLPIIHGGGIVQQATKEAVPWMDERFGLKE